MRRVIVVGVLAAVAAAAAYCCVNYQIEVRRGEAGLESITIRPKAGSPATGESSGRSTDGATQPLVRIATFNLDGLDEKKLADPRISAVLTQVITRFDVVAVQGVRAGNLGVLTRLVEQVNAGGGQYDSATYPAATPDAAGQYAAFLFSRANIEIDRSTIQRVGNQGGQFSHPPLAALFRAKGPDPAEAFTFRLVNVHVDTERASGELDLLDEVYSTVRAEQPREDDVILLGSFGAAAGEDRLGERLALASSIADTPTTLRGTGPADNILFDPRATTEFAGRVGVLDLMREFDLTWREAAEISDHLPVWAEFSALEGVGTTHVAARAGETGR